jgi:RNA-binding protein
VTVWIGKKGCTESTIDEIRNQLRQRRIVKVRWLRNTDVDPEAIAARSGGRLLLVRGRTMVLTDRQMKS